jgi:hypothetical protein
MTKVTVEISTDSDFRATEIVADLRNMAEILFYPMRCVGFWDEPTGGHICPQLQLGKDCPHRADGLAPSQEEYQRTVEDQLRGVLEVDFPHAGVHIYLG